MKSYFFVLGNSSALSVAEILNRFDPSSYFLINKKILRVDFEDKIDAEKAILKIGGTIKIVELISENFQDLFLEIEKFLPEEFDGKYKFGFSFHDDENIDEKKLAMNIKKELKSRKISCRWITSRNKQLSSVVVTKNKLIDSRSDFVVIGKGTTKFFGITKAVQDFENLSKRDYQRPSRDSHSGMIPPKLAQIMLNIGLRGNANKILLDPFCGSGTILMEAYLLGVKNIKGTDLSEKAIRDSQVNLEWVKNNFQSGQRGRADILKCDVRKLSQKIDDNSVDLIVTEPYLGPQRKIGDIEKEKKSLENLYSEAIIEFSKVLKQKGRIVMIWPVLRKAKDPFLNPNFKNFQIINQIPDEFNLKQTGRKTIIYGRRSQRIWREIVVLEKTN